MGEVIRGPWIAARQAKPISQPCVAVVHAQAEQTALLPDFCARCGRVLCADSPSEGKTCTNCGHLNSHASLGADY